MYEVCKQGQREKKLINLRAKRGGYLFETGSEREEHGGVPSAQNGAVQKWRKAWLQSDETRTEGLSVQDAGTYSWVLRSCVRNVRNCARSALKRTILRVLVSPNIFEG